MQEGWAERPQGPLLWFHALTLGELPLLWPCCTAAVLLRDPMPQDTFDQFLVLVTAIAVLVVVARRQETWPPSLLTAQHIQSLMKACKLEVNPSRSCYSCTSFWSHKACTMASVCGLCCAGETAVVLPVVFRCLLVRLAATAHAAVTGSSDKCLQLSWP
jgi:hypothetical protein